MPSYESNLKIVVTTLMIFGLLIGVWAIAITFNGNHRFASWPVHLILTLFLTPVEIFVGGFEIIAQSNAPNQQQTGYATV